MSMINNQVFLNYSSDEIQWNGPTISCIDLYTGDIISSIINDIALQICSLVKEFDDLETIDLECIINKCDETLCMEDHTLSNLLRILQKNDCSIKSLIDDTVDIINGKKDIKLDLDLSCLKTCPDYFNPKYNFICANSGNPGDEISVKYYTLFNPNPVTVILKNSQCLRFDLPKDKVTILQTTKLTPTSYITATVVDSIGFDNCPNCEAYIPYLINTTAFPGYLKQNEFTLSQILQYLIYRLCCHDVNIGEIEIKLSEIETLYSDILRNFTAYTEPVLSTCINNTPLIHSLLTTRLSDYVCSLRNDTGTTTQIQNSINQQCNAKWISNDYPQILCGPFAHDVIVSSVVIDGVTYIINQNIGYGQPSLAVTALNSNLPTSLAQFSEDSSGQIQYNNICSSIILFITECDGVTLRSVNFNTNYITAVTLSDDSNNQWSVIYDILRRVKNQELSTCCLPDCGELKFGYRIVYSASDSIYKVIFSKVYGSSITESWTDSGSILTVKDITGITYITNITITEESEFELDLDGLDVSKVMNLSIKTKFINDNGLVCKDIIVDHLDPIPTECAFCKLCAYGSVLTDSIRVTYYTTDSNVTTTQVLTTGLCLSFKLPDEKPTIVNTTSLVRDSDIILAPDPSSDCSEDIVIPEPVPNTCWFFPIPMDHYKDTLDTTYILDYYKLVTQINPSGNLISGKSLVLYNLGSATPGGNTVAAYCNTFTLPAEVVTLSTCSSYEITFISGVLIPPIANMGGGFGLILEIQGQDEGVVPELILSDPITGTKLIVKGVFTEDCLCPA